MSDQKPTRRIHRGLRVRVDTARQPFAHGFAIGCGMVAALFIGGLIVCLFLVVFSLVR